VTPYQRKNILEKLLAKLYRYSIVQQMGGAAKMGPSVDQSGNGIIAQAKSTALPPLSVQESMSSRTNRSLAAHGLFDQDVEPLETSTLEDPFGFNGPKAPVREKATVGTQTKAVGLVSTKMMILLLYLLFPRVSSLPGFSVLSLFTSYPCSHLMQSMMICH
jgi:hypothetical protein